MNEKGIRAGIDEFVQEEVWGQDHEMRFERQRSQFSQRLNNRRAHGNVGHEMTIHDVHMKAVGLCLHGFVDLCRKMSEIGSENRWCQFHTASVNHPALLFAHSEMFANSRTTFSPSTTIVAARGAGSATCTARFWVMLIFSPGTSRRCARAGRFLPPD
jgi:hypothetical protein